MPKKYFQIWCAAAVDMTGGRTRDGGSIVGASVFYHDLPRSESADDGIEALDAELRSGSRNVEEAEQQNLSSLVWICTSTHSISKVTVIDANSPADVLESFHVCSSHLLCIASVPGAKEDDYKVDEELNKLIVEESELREQDEARKIKLEGEIPEETGIGAVSFVSCATGTQSLESQDDRDEGEFCLKFSLSVFIKFSVSMQSISSQYPVSSQSVSSQYPVSIQSVSS